MEGLMVFFIIIFNVITACSAAWLAEQKGYIKSSWFIFGIFGGIIALLTIIGAPNKSL